MGTLGGGNHYAEIQVVDEIFDEFAARKMGIEFVGQVCIMIHSGSRGLGHQVRLLCTLLCFIHFIHVPSCYVVRFSFVLGFAGIKKRTFPSKPIVIFPSQPSPRHCFSLPRQLLPMTLSRLYTLPPCRWPPTP